jgi:hypothetical protein
MPMSPFWINVLATLPSWKPVTVECLKIRVDLRLLVYWRFAVCTLQTYRNRARPIYLRSGSVYVCLEWFQQVFLNARFVTCVRSGLNVSQTAW